MDIWMYTTIDCGISCMLIIITHLDGEWSFLSLKDMTSDGKESRDEKKIAIRSSSAEIVLVRKY